MAFETFEQPIYVQRKHYIEEIDGLDDVFDFLDEWPQEKRDLVYEVMVDACRKAASRQLPVQAVANNFLRFLKEAWQARRCQRRTLASVNATCISPIGGAEENLD